MKSINVAEDRKDDGHQASPLAGKVRSSGLLATPASATLHMPCAADPASLPGYVSWLELQHQHAVRQLDRLDKLQVSVDLWLKLYPILSLERVAHTFNLSFETTCTAHNYAHLNRAFNQLQHHVNTSTQRVGSSPDVDFA